MLPNNKSVHCRKHVIKTPEQIAKIAAAIRGQKRSPSQRARMSRVKKAAAAKMLASGVPLFGGKGIRTPLGRVHRRTCKRCKKAFVISKPCKESRFCSRRCGYLQRRGKASRMWLSDMPHIVCPICGKSVRLPARSMLGKRVCCSNRCRGIWGKKRQRNKDTNIERIMRAGLEERGWRFQEQQQILAITIPDFFIPAIKAVIYCDGDYWHSLPVHLKRDNEQTVALTAAGYKVFRFLGSKILADVKACLDQVAACFPPDSADK
jgi:very-short-patch-repair endonuclease